MPNGAVFPGIGFASARKHNAGLSPNQKSMVRASTGGEPSLEEVKRHMRRISQPCGMEMKRDALSVKGDLLEAHQTLSRPDAKDDLDEETLVGEAHATPKKKIYMD